MPDSVEMPAPVKATILLAVAIMRPSSSSLPMRRSSSLAMHLLERVPTRALGSRDRRPARAAKMISHEFGARPPDAASAAGRGGPHPDARAWPPPAEPDRASRATPDPAQRAHSRGPSA